MRSLPCILALLGGCFSKSDMLAELDRDGDGDYHTAAADLGEGGPFDCDDANADVGPHATEACNGIDDDCDGDIDEAGADGEITWYLDGDRDGYGDPATSRAACAAPELYIATSGDCDDGDRAVHPGVTDVCNDADDDCDGNTDEDPPPWYPDEDGDGFGDPDGGLEVCEAPNDYIADGTDCDDDDPDVSPDADEVCDGQDNDCDGLLDRDDPSNTGDATWYADVDADGYGDSAIHQAACSQPAGYTRKSGDCADEVAAVHPNAPEICEDGTDDDCDGVDLGCGIAGTDTLANATARFATTNEYFFGLTLGNADADGLGDALLGAFDFGASDTASGHAYLLHGSPLVTVRGDVNASSLDAWYEGDVGDALGNSVALPGDLDGDGYPEVVLGAPAIWAGRTGSVYIDYGSATRRAGKISRSAMVQLVGGSSADGAGYRLAAGGDVDGDGFDDFLASAPGDGAGRVYRVGGRSARYTSSDSFSSVADFWEGDAADPLAGLAISGGFDLDGDGLDDFAVMTEARAYLVLGGGSSGGSLSDADGVLAPFTSNCGDIRGLSMGPDVDGDGQDDWLVALACDTSDFAGEAWLFTAGTTLGSATAPVAFGDAASFTVTGSSPDDRCSNVTALGDADGDGQGDLAIGCYDVADSGTVYVFSGASASGTTTTASAYGARTGPDGGETGSVLAQHPGDVNGDGYVELMTAGFVPPTAYLLYGGP